MIDTLMFASLVALMIIISGYICFLYSKAVYAYIIDGADLRVCTMSQCIIFLILMNFEFVSFSIRKTVCMVDIYLFRVYISYLFYFISASRLLGYKSLFFPKKLKNAAYIAITLGFYVSTTLEIFFLTKIQLPADCISKIDLIDYMIIANNDVDTPRILSIIPGLYSLVCYVFIILFDALEKRGTKTLLLDILTDLSLMFYIIINLMNDVNYMSRIFTLLMYILPLVSIIFEIQNIMWYCSKEKNTTEYLRGLINSSYKLTGAKRIYNARLISKIIELKPELANNLPNDTKFEDFISLINKFNKKEGVEQ